MKNRGTSSSKLMLTATGCGLSVPPLGAHHGPPLGGISNTTSSGRGCLFTTDQEESVMSIREMFLMLMDEN